MEKGGKIDFASLWTELEKLAATEFEECWYFDSQRSDARGNSALAAEYHGLKFARPLAPQFQVKVFSTKRYKCQCRKCGSHFTQNEQKGVDNGIATKLLTLTLQNHIDRLIIFSDDGDFYTSLGYVRNTLLREVWVVGFLGTVSGDLQQLASRIVWVDDIWSRIKNRGREDPTRPNAMVGSWARTTLCSTIKSPIRAIPQPTRILEEPRAIRITRPRQA